MAKWINDDGTFAENWTEGLPTELREYAKDAKDITTLVKRGVDTKREFSSRVKLPEDDDGKRKFVKEHFGSILDADSAAAKKKQDEESAAAQKKAEEQVVADKQKRLDDSEKTLKDLWGEKDYDKNLELCRRALRSDHVPKMVKEQVAKACGVEPDKLTDDQIKYAVAHDPFVAELLRPIGTLIQDGRLQHGDGHKEEREVKPMQPKCPDLYKNRPDGDPEKKWFIKRGYNYTTMEWDGRPPE